MEDLNTCKTGSQKAQISSATMIESPTSESCGKQESGNSDVLFQRYEEKETGQAAAPNTGLEERKPEIMSRISECENNEKLELEADSWNKLLVANVLDRYWREKGEAATNEVSKEENKPVQSIRRPKKEDVLFGRKEKQRQHPGNVLLRGLCDEYRDLYEGSQRDDKTVITWRILKEIQKQHGRFLKYEVTQRTWTEVTDDIAREKVSFTMRDTKPKISCPGNFAM